MLPQLQTRANLVGKCLVVELYCIIKKGPMQFHKGTIVSTFHSFMLQSLIIDVKKNVLEADFDQLLQPIKINFIYNWRMHSCQLRFSRKKLRGNLNFMPV